MDNKTLDLSGMKDEDLLKLLSDIEEDSNENVK